MRAFITACVFLSWALPVSGQAYRPWWDREHKHSVVAKYVGVSDSVATLRRKDNNKLVAVPATALSRDSLIDLIDHMCRFGLHEELTIQASPVQPGEPVLATDLWEFVRLAPQWDSEQTTRANEMRWKDFVAKTRGRLLRFTAVVIDVDLKYVILMEGRQEFRFNRPYEDFRVIGVDPTKIEKGDEFSLLCTLQESENPTSFSAVEFSQGRCLNIQTLGLEARVVRGHRGKR